MSSHKTGLLASKGETACCGYHQSCPVCDSADIALKAEIPFYSTEGQYLTNVFKCQGCGTFYRDVDLSRAVEKHFEISPYTAVDNACKYDEVRRGYFQYLLGLIQKQRPIDADTRVLDIGCSYGHLLRTFGELTRHLRGVEIMDKTRKYAQSLLPEAEIVKNLGEISHSGGYDIVTLVDFLYYADRPVEVLRKVRSLISKDGLMLIRVTNRTWLLNMFFLRSRWNYLSDAKYAFSDRAMRLMLQKAGFEIIYVTGRETGKNHKVFKKHLEAVLYRVGNVLSTLGLNTLSPGLIYLVRPV